MKIMDLANPDFAWGHSWDAILDVRPIAQFHEPLNLDKDERIFAWFVTQSYPLSFPAERSRGNLRRSGGDIHEKQYA